MVSNHLLLSLTLHAIFKANSQSTPLILCNLNPESTNSKQEWNLFHDVSGLKNISWLILVSKLKKNKQDVE